MDDWQNDDDFKHEDTGRILSLTSGNIQLLPEYSKHQTNAGRSLSFNTTSPITGYGGRRYPAASATLTSHNGHDFSKRKYAFRRLQRRFELSMRYHQRPEYRRYRERARKDVDKDGKVIWTDDMEEAFSNALINIPPMGRRKRSQHGRSYGRNELIREWMLQETGEDRKRKQISSHIQVLDHVFKDFPDWKRLNKVPNASAAPEPELYDYYNDSVADMVRNWPALKNLLLTSSTSDINSTILMPPILRSNDAFSDRHPLKRIDFEMWIGPSSNVDKCLHRYTRSVSNEISLKANHPLESIKDWRQRYPDLESIVSDFSPSRSCDIVLLDTHLEMMTDFPFEQVKLGINFQLEFFNAECHGVHEPGCLESFSCLTRMYQDGKFLRQTEADNCQVIGHGRMKPPFESKWWAQEFVHLTDRFRMAEDSGNIMTIAAAAEATQNFFRNLTVMQQIFTSVNQTSIHFSSTQSNLETQRVAVLLWTFSQAVQGQAAVTIPRKLVLPPNRSATNSPLPPNDNMMPPFALDTHVTASADGLFDAAFNPLPAFNPPITQEYSSDMEELCQDGFMVLAQRKELDFNTKLKRPSGLSQQVRHDHNSLHSLEELGRLQGIPSSQPTLPNYRRAVHPSNQSATDVNRPQQIPINLKQQNSMRLLDGNLGESSLEQQCTPLQKFDASTHDILQEQLAQFDHHLGHDSRIDGDHSYRLLRENGFEPDFDQTSLTLETIGEEAPISYKSYLPTDEVWHNFPSHQSQAGVAGLLVRPSIPHHHSFAGVLQTEETGLDTPRKTFTRLLEQMEMDTSNGDSNEHNPHAHVNHSEFVRSQSQPAPDLHLDPDWMLVENDGSIDAPAAR